MSDFTIIIRGPLHQKSLQNIPRYLKDAKVVVSHWEDGISLDYYRPTISQDVKEQLNSYGDSITIVENEYSKLPAHAQIVPGLIADWKPNIYQFYSTFKGLEQTTTPFFITCRSDSSYPDLLPFMERIRNNPDKIVTCDINFRPDWAYKFHPGQHVLGGKSQLLKRVFGLCLDVAPNKYSKYTQLIKKFKAKIRQPLVGEQFFCGCALTILEEAIIPEKSKEIMKKHFEIVNIWELGDIEWTAAFLEHRYITKETKTIIDEQIMASPWRKYISNIKDI